MTNLSSRCAINEAHLTYFQPEKVNFLLLIAKYKHTTSSRRRLTLHYGFYIIWQEIPQSKKLSTKNYIAFWEKMEA